MMRSGLRRCTLCLPLLLTVACDLPAATYDSYDAGLAQTVNRMVAALAEVPDASLVIPPLRRTDGSLPELGTVVADDLVIGLSRSVDRVSVCNRTGIEEIFQELDLERRGLVDEDEVHELGRFCGADILLLGTLFAEGDNLSVRLKLVDTETAKALTGDRFEVPPSTAKRGAMARPLAWQPFGATDGTEEGSTPRSRDDGVPQHDTVGDFTLTLRTCKFIQHDGLFCRLEIHNDQVVTRKLTILASTLLLDNQGDEYHAHAYQTSERSKPVPFSSATPNLSVEVPAGMMRRIEIIFRVDRPEQKAQVLEVHAPDGMARFEGFDFDRDEN